ncbi:acetoin utilization AcuB family protein [Aneurinibacillus sp. Ricciae_BoGa-3]|uniref:acetoin utilization AcuB family protein n=1 Tax=Aneurinibacillus sp. Ricciae_BoGa-3 TaxID=3022697 RepID=UPI002342411A|nr:acetoin utilization AcuB family protein [Aneurinibacillus sp. Ricciae_BoGa-3]WCK55770.1 acetoin utilization AcuB family protein [Aneurinibacillus sp. Ricciae_BoGa-3]
MLVENIMKRDIITVSPTDSIRLCLLKVDQNRIRHLPVVEKGRLVGILSDRDVRDACPSLIGESHEDDNQVMSTPISVIMRKDVITCHPLDFVEEAALAMYDNHIGCLPVVAGDELKGIVTETDILHTLVELMGVHYPSSHIEVEVDDRPGLLADITQLFKEANCNVTSVLVFPGRHSGNKNLVFRVQTIDPRKIVSKIEEAGYRVVWPSELEGSV